MNTIQTIKNDVLTGKLIDKKQALSLVTVPLAELCAAANEIREFFCGNDFDICTIINGKSGRCSEDCKYCAQSVSYNTKNEKYSLLGTDELVSQAQYNDEQGVLRYSIVTSGKSLKDDEIDQVSQSIKAIKEQTNISVCVSFGLLDESQFTKLKAAGASRVHNNLESSRDYFPNICTTHTYDDKIHAIHAAKQAGLSVCSGGIMGLGESMEDRIDMALILRELKINSIPLNMLNPVAGTPFEGNLPLTNDEMCRIVAIYRFILPNTFIRLAGGRGLLPDQGKKCFLSGANAAISGDMLTTAGISIKNDLKMINDLGYQLACANK
ncbi:MAG TPA: biotin synthase BioB [Epulopiscium sp.]|nr:biotin synthase BioB [Candidatus Epulonipiscium sp.]